MPQHDFDIANQSAPNFRADLNNALEALGTLSSGSTAPATTYANQLWYDTANNILKMRNEADSAWIELFDFDQGAGTSFPSNVPQVIDEDDFTSNSATRPPSQQSTKAYVDAGDQKQIGVGQTWQDVLSIRTSGTIYQNTTGKPIMVAVRGSGSQESIQVSEDGVTFVTVGYNGLSGGWEDSCSFIVPNNHYYRCNGGGRGTWAELR